MKTDSLPTNPTFGEVVRKLLRHKWQIILITGAITLAGMIVVISLPRSYTVDCEIVAEHESLSRSSLAGAMGMLGGIAGLGDEARDGITLELAPSIVQSDPFLLELADIPVDMLRRPKNFHAPTTFGDFVMNGQRSPWWSFASLRRPKAPVGISSVIDDYVLSRIQIAFIRRVSGMISLKADKRAGKLTLRVTTQDPLTSAIVVDTLTGRLQHYLIAYQTKKANARVVQLTAMTNVAREQYHAAQNAYSRSMDRNQDLVSQSARATQERLSNELSIALQLYTGMALKLEQARTRVLDNTPSFTVLTPPVTDRIPSAPRRKVATVVTFVLGLFVAMLSVLLPDIWRSITSLSSRS